MYVTTGWNPFWRVFIRYSIFNSSIFYSIAINCSPNLKTSSKYRSWIFLRIFQSIRIITITTTNNQIQNLMKTQIHKNKNSTSENISPQCDTQYIPHPSCSRIITQDFLPWTFADKPISVHWKWKCSRDGHDQSHFR